MNLVSENQVSKVAYKAKKVCDLNKKLFKSQIIISKLDLNHKFKTLENEKNLLWDENKKKQKELWTTHWMIKVRYYLV